MDYDNEMLSLFILDMEDSINMISSGLLSLENNQNNPGIVDEIMRAAHNLKGSSAMMNFNRMKDLTHAVETVMQKIRGNKLQISQSLISLLLSGLDRIQLIRDQIINGNDNVEISDLVEKLNNFESGDNSATITETPTASPSNAVSKALPVEIAKKMDSQQYIKVNTKILGNLISQINKLILMQTQLLNLNKELYFKNPLETKLKESSSILTHVGKNIRNIQDELIRTKMTSLDHVVNKFPRMIRDLEIALEKKIELSIEVGNVRLDQNIADEIGNPLMHILRNSADHGIELPTERLKQGKSEKGLVKISATNKSNQITIIVEDDGNGLDEEKILKTAINKGIISEEDSTKLSKQNIINLIFSPGFSTADKVTDVSGRGVGMDVVKTHIEKINGTLEIESEKGRGTKIIIKAPSTMSVLPCTLIEINDTVLCLPSININKVLNIDKRDVNSTSSFNFIIFNGVAIPLIGLHAVFGGQPKEYKGSYYAVVLGLAEKKAAILVDRLLGSQKVIIRPLGSIMGKPPIIAGSTILEDSKIGLVLDIAEIVAVKQFAVDSLPLTASKIS